jgi:hypothetical protein
MVIERFKNGDAVAIGKRFRECGRMLPKGVIYHASWVDAASARCFQLMEAEHPELLEEWVGKWQDLVDFEIVPVMTSGEYWSRFEAEQP